MNGFFIDRFMKAGRCLLYE